jgi:hypothetical protein
VTLQGYALEAAQEAIEWMVAYEIIEGKDA